MNNQLNTLNNFFSQFRPLKYKKGEIIIRPDDNTSGAFFLKSGYVRLYSISSNGQEITFNIFKPGSYFSMMWAIGDSSNSYFFEAMSEVEVDKAPKENFLKFLKSEPEVMFELTKRVLLGLNGLLWVMEHLLFSNARSRVISVILVSAKRFGQKDGRGEITIDLPLTHQNIASLAGLTRETTSIEIGKLEREKILAYKKHLLVVKDVERMEEELLTPVADEPEAHAL